MSGADPTVLLPAGPPLPVIPGYTLESLLGEGGMGRVFRARDQVLGRRVAIKLISDPFAGQAGERARQRFLREAQVMAQLDHPNLVRVHAGGEHEGASFLVMELIEGETLADLVRRRGWLETGEALGLLAQVIRGLQAAWQRGIVHRDIKPSNVLIDANGTAKVADFGLARPALEAEQAQVTLTGEILGSPHYMSPERIRGEANDFRGDIYALGIMLFEMLAGHPPFQGDTVGAILAKHLQQPLLDLRQQRPNVPEGVVRLIERMTFKEPAGRPGSYDELLRQVEALQRPVGTPTIRSAAPHRPGKRALRNIRRRRFALLGGAALVLLAAGFAGWLRYGRQAAPEPAAPVREAAAPARPRPLPFAARPGASPEELARELERFRTGALGIDWSPRGWPSPDSPASGSPLQFRVRTGRAAHALLLYLDGGGDLYSLYPFGREPGTALAPDQETVLPMMDTSTLPTLEGPGRGWAVLVLSPSPLVPPVVQGARPQGPYVVYPARVGTKAQEFPAFQYLSWLTGALRAESTADWDLRIHAFHVKESL